MLLQGGACASTVAALQRLGVMLQVSHPQIVKAFFVDVLPLPSYTFCRLAIKALSSQLVPCWSY
jgi:hypothetical protein